MRKLPVNDHMTPVVKIDIISSHMEIGLFSFYSEHYFYCMFIEKPCIFSKHVQLPMSVKHIVQRNFVKIFTSKTMK